MCPTSYREILGRRLLYAGFPERHLDLPQPTGPWGMMLDKLWSQMARGTILAIVGDRGRGKTQMATNLAARAILKGLRVKYTKAMSFFVEVRSTYSESEMSEKSILNAYTAPDVLVLDEIHERGETDWENRMLTHVVDRRYDAMRDTILIGNLAKDDLLRALGPSIASRIMECGGVALCDWQDFRKER